MKNLKRMLCTLLVIIMMTGTVSVSAASRFNDVATGNKYAEAIELLAGLKIINGYEDGSFRPGDTITRAEAAAIMVRVMGYEDDVVKGQTNYSDVKYSHWASGYVNVATSLGIINGMPDGTFCPEDNVTYEQMVKMIVCAIGHELKATTYGGYPDGYIRAASEASVTKGLSGYVGQEASRGVVAQLVYNALEVEMMDATSFSNGILGNTYSLNGKTILADYLGIEKVDAVVTDSYMASEVYSAKDKHITLDITKVYSLNNRKSNALYDAGDVIDFEEGEYSYANTYLGYAVTAYVGEDSDSGKDMIYAITLDDARNDVVEITPDNFDEDESNDNYVSYAKRATDKKLTVLDLDRNLLVVVNGIVVNKNISEYYEYFDVMEFVNNDRDSYYDAVFVTMYDESEGVEFVVTDIEEDDGLWYFEGEDGEIEIDTEDDDIIVRVIRDGEAAKLDDISYGDVLTCLDASAGIITVYVSSSTVSGMISEVDYDTEEYFIKNKAYTLSPAFSEELEAGDEGVFYLNYQGKIAYSTVKSSVTSGDYVFVANYDTKTSFSKVTYLVQVVTESGSVKTYTLKNKVKYIDTNGNLYKSVTDATVYNYLKENKTDLSNDFGVEGYVGLARVKTSSSGVISEIYLPGKYEEFYAQTKYATENTKEYSSTRGTYGNYDLDRDVIVFSVDNSEESIADAVEVGTVGEFFTNGDNYMFIAYGERNKDIEALVLTNGVSALSYEDHAIIITKISTVVVDDEKTTKITGLQKGKTVTYVIDPEESFDIRIGNIVLIKCNASNYITKLEKVADTTNSVNGLFTAFEDADIPSDEDAGVFGGMVQSKSGSKFFIEGVEDAFYSDTKTSYYVIDYTGRDTTYVNGAFSSIKTSTSSVASYVIARTYEDDLVDVFIFRYDADEDDVPTTDIWDKSITVEEETEPTTEATEATTEAPTEPATEATTEAPTEATTEATEATTEATEATTEAPTAATTEATEATTEAPTAATTEATEEVTLAEVPTQAPTEPATEVPTFAPTEPVTEAPTQAPTEPVTEAPTQAPTEPVTEAPTQAPTEPATEAPTQAPTEPVTEAPTFAPTEPATEVPTQAPTEAVTEAPTQAPTEATTEEPTEEAGTEATEPVTEAPTQAPTEPVTEAPTQAPTQAPTEATTEAAKDTAKDYYNRMIALKSKYPEGTVWNNNNYYTWKGGLYSGGYGCAGFAFMLSDAAFGTLPAREVKTNISISTVKVGDILRLDNDSHSVIILEVHSDYVVIAEGNYNNSVHWGRKLTAAEVAAASYMITRYPQ